MKHTAITLIGMPGAGKSTAGVLLAKRLVLKFVDADLVIQEHTGVPLQTTIEQSGYAALRQIEEEVLLQLPVAGYVVATGGSAVYSDAAMRRLSGTSLLVYLQVTYNTAVSRVGDFGERGIAKPAGQSFRALFDERTALYRQWAAAIVNADQPIEQVVDDICALVES